MAKDKAWLDGELWNFVRGAALDLEIPSNSPREEGLYRNMKQVCEVYARLVAVEGRAPAPQPANLPTLEEWMLQMYPGANLGKMEIPARVCIEIAKSYAAAATPQVTPQPEKCGQRFTCAATGLRIYVCALEKGHEGECDDHLTRGLAVTPQVTPTLIEELDPEHVQPPYDHDGECSYCRTKEGDTHPATCTWEKLKLVQRGTSEQASPTPDKCPQCGVDKNWSFCLG